MSDEFTEAVNFLQDAIEYLRGEREYEDGPHDAPDPDSALNAIEEALDAIALERK